MHADQGANFESDLLKELCKILGIKKSRTTPYHPMGIGGTERMNRTLFNMLETLEPENKSNLKLYLPSLVYDYNCTKHETTKFTPVELMFGRTPKIPIDATLESVPQSGQRDSGKYIKELKERLKKTQGDAKEYSDKARNKQKTYYDRRARASAINIGDTVLVRRVHHGEGKHKLVDKLV